MTADKRLTEIPPTAGLPARWSDFFGAPPEPLEAGLARFIGVPETQIVWSGTAALIVALETLKRRSSRREVVIPAYTCPLVALAVAQCGLTIRLCDIMPGRFDLDVDSLRACTGQETLCIVPGHLAGHTANLNDVLEIARAAGAYVIEDTAQSLGATWQGKPAGISGDIGFFSLGVGKGLTMYGGGALAARDPELRDALKETGRAIAPAHRPAEIRRCIELLGYRMFYNPAGLRWFYGANLRRSLSRGEPERAVGDVFSGPIPLHAVSTFRKNAAARALTRLPDAIVQHAARGRERAARLEAIPDLSVVRERAGDSGTWPIVMALFRDERKTEAALAKLWTSGLGVTKLFVRALPDYAYLKSVVPHADVPNARYFAARHLTISNSPWLSDEDFERVVRLLGGA